MQTLLIILMAVIGVAALTLFVLFILSIRDFGADNNMCWLFLLSSILFTGAFVFTLYSYNQPHHGFKPTMQDYPTKAYIQETKIINGTDTTYIYQLKWNDECNK